MKKMQLSEAIRLGSLLVANPTAGDIDRCAISMALHAHGEVPDPSDVLCPDDAIISDEDFDEEVDVYSPLPVRRAEATSENWFNALRSHQALAQIYTWLGKSFTCPWCGCELVGTQVVHHPFDYHVMTAGIGMAQITMDELCSWIATIEPPPERWGVTLDLGLGVHFANAQEKEAVIRAAAEAKLSPNAYIAAAVRLALKYHLPLDDFQCADPVIGPRDTVHYAPRKRSECAFPF